MPNPIILKVLLFFTILIVGCQWETESYLSKLEGRWINENSDLLIIRDTTTNNNYVGTKARSRGISGKHLEIIKDTLSFQERYWISKDDHSVRKIDKTDFRINSVSDSFLSITPVSTFANKLFEKDTIELTRQKFAVDNNIKFEKIIFHTTHCFGHCPIYHLEINKNGQARLHKEEIYKEVEKGNFIIDTLNIGYHSGVLSTQLLTELEHHLKTCNLETLECDGPLCCDGSIKTIIVYHNGKRKYLKYMFPPAIVSNLINQLYHICQAADLQKTKIEFTLEE